MPRALGDGRGVVKKKVKRLVNGRAVTETRLFVRVRSKDEATGKRRSKWKRVANLTEAKAVQQQLAAELRSEKEQPAAAAAKTFGDLATHYAATSLRPAEYRGGRKVSGRRSLSGLHRRLTMLCDFFGARAAEGEENVWKGGARLRSITHERLAELRAARFKAPVQVTERNPGGRPRSVATVNRELQMLRNMLSVAVGKRWLDRNPFRDPPDGRPLISTADEISRRRLLSFDEEDRLLAECVNRTELRPGKPPRNVRRAHLRAVIICALDTAMREGEIFKLRVRDLDAMTGGGRRELTVQQMNTKSLRERGAPISKRLRAEFDRLRSEKPWRPGDLVFGISSNVRRSFAGACRDAGITGLRFHDLRRTAATRLHREGMPIGELRHILGHADIKTTQIYIGVDDETTDRAADLLDRMEERREKERGRKKAPPPAERADERAVAT